MVQQTPQSRLLANLLKSTKDYSTSLTNHILISHTSLSGLQAYASASSPSTVGAIFGVAEALKGADDALVRYSNEVEHWRERLKEVRSAEEDVGNILRDREILVTRLIKASSKKPNRESVMNPPSPTASVTSFGTTNGGGSRGLSAAQAELQACEKQLGEKQRQLEQIRSIAIRDGLEQRCNALVQLGQQLSQKGNEGVRALQEGYAAKDPNGDAVHMDLDVVFRNLPPRPSSPNGMSDASLAPSQSASQNGDTKGTSNAGKRASTAYPPYRIPLPAPHAIDHNISTDGHNVPFTATATRITEEDEGSSSGSEAGPVNVVENQKDRRSSALPPHLTRDNTLTHRAHSSDIGPSSPGTPRKPIPRRGSTSSSVNSNTHKKRSGFFGAVAGLFRSNKQKKDGGRDESPTNSPLKQSFSPKDRAWSTRTDQNLRRASGGNSSSEEVDTRQFVSVSNKARSPLSITVPPASAATSRGGAAGPRKLVRSNSASKVPSSSVVAKKKKKGSSSALGTTTVPNRPPDATMPTDGAAAIANAVASAGVSRSGTVRSSTSETPRTPARARHASLGSSTPPARQGSIRENTGPGKPLKLTPASPDGTAWLKNSPAVTPSASAHNRSQSTSASVRSAPSVSSGHRRRASQENGDPQKTSNLMTLVEGVVADRQRSETLSTVKGMMLPSDFMKLSAGPPSVPTLRTVTAPPPLTATVPTFNVNPPTPGETEKRFPIATSVGDPSRASNGTAELRHTPPPRSVSPLRSALRHREPSPSPVVMPAPSSSAVVPAAALAPAPRAIAAPVGVRPVSLTESDVEAYETGQEDIDDEDDADGQTTPTKEKEGVVPASATLTQRAQLQITNKVSPPGTDLSVSTADGGGAGSNVARRKSVRLDVPPSASSYTTAFPKVLAPPSVSKTSNKPLPAPASSTTSGNGSAWQSRIADDTQVALDTWADSSEEDEDYKHARKMLAKANKKEKAVKDEVAAYNAAASSTPSRAASKKRHSAR